MPDVINRLKRICILALILALPACAENSAVSTLAKPVSGDLPTPASVSATRGDYRISAQDIIDVNVYQVPDLSRSLQVDAAGNIVMPLIGAVRASGRTVREVEAEIANKLGAKYLQNPQVFVSIKDAIGLRVTIEGAVNKPGVVVASGEMTLLRVLAQAEGFKETAASSEVLVFRQTPQGRVVAKFDANAIRSGKATDPPIYGGDTIVVDDSMAKTAWKQFREAIPALGLFKLFI